MVYLRGTDQAQQLGADLHRAGSEVDRGEADLVAVEDGEFVDRLADAGVEEEAGGAVGQGLVWILLGAQVGVDLIEVVARQDAAFRFAV